MERRFFNKVWPKYCKIGAKFFFRFTWCVRLREIPLYIRLGTCWHYFDRKEIYTKLGLHLLSKLLKTVLNFETYLLIGTLSKKSEIKPYFAYPHLIVYLSCFAWNGYNSDIARFTFIATSTLRGILNIGRFHLSYLKR